MTPNPYPYSYSSAVDCDFLSLQSMLMEKLIFLPEIIVPWKQECRPHRRMIIFFLCSLPSRAFSIICNSTFYSTNHGAFYIDFVSMAFWSDFYRISIHGPVAKNEPSRLMKYCWFWRFDSGFRVTAFHYARVEQATCSLDYPMDSSMHSTTIWQDRGELRGFRAREWDVIVS